MQNLQIVGSAKYLQNVWAAQDTLSGSQGLIMLWMKSEVMTLSSCPHHTALSPWPAGQCPQWGGGPGQVGKIPLKIQQCSINSLMRTLTLSNPISLRKSVPIHIFGNCWPVFMRNVIQEIFAYMLGEFYGNCRTQAQKKETKSEVSLATTLASGATKTGPS